MGTFYGATSELPISRQREGTGGLPPAVITTRRPPVCFSGIPCDTFKNKIFSRTVSPSGFDRAERRGGIGAAHTEALCRGLMKGWQRRGRAGRLFARLAPGTHGPVSAARHSVWCRRHQSRGAALLYERRTVADSVAAGASLRTPPHHHHPTVILAAASISMLMRRRCGSLPTMRWRNWRKVEEVT